jgi:hypothetical protein
MKYLRYNPEIEHVETCFFVEYKGTEKVLCGKPAVGIRGAAEPLCAEHFDYCRSLDGVMNVEVIQEGGLNG